jgi:signal peptidase I
MRPEGSVDQGKPADVEAEPATEPQPAAEPPAVREPPAVPEPAAVMSARNRRADIAPQPTAKVEPAADATDEAAEDDELVARPRPFAGAPAVYQKPAISAAASGRDPIADFFTRKDDDDEKKRWRRKKKDGAPAKVDKPQEKPAGKPAGKRKPWPKAARSAFRTLVVVAIAVAAALLLRAFVVEPYYVPSQSMEPTLHGCQGCNDDHVLVEKLSYLFHDPQPGDIVVFNRPSTWKVPDNVLIKRVIGVPGDDIRLQGGKVYRNGSRLDEPYVNQKCRHGTLPRNGSSKRKVYPPVPNGEVFVMGDNRCDSEDSRYFGVVPQSKIIGRAFLIIWPVGRIHSLS